jgi:hypothetical protein
MGHRLKRMARGQRGANLIEMALVTTLLLLLFGGVVDLGRAFHSYIVITNAAREGARMGSHFPEREDLIDAAAIQEAAESGVVLSAGDVDVEFPARSSAPGNPIRVSVVYEVPMFMGGIFGYGASLTLTGYAEMVIFGRDL